MTGLSGVELRRRGVRVRVAPEAREWVSTALDATGSLYDYAGRYDPGAHGLRGRGEVRLVEAEPAGGTPGDRWVVRHGFRGGLLGPVLGDRYLRAPGVPRPFREWDASLALRARGFLTPTVLAAAVYPDGAFYRTDVVTRFVSDAVELPEALQSGGGLSENRASLLEEVGALVARLGLCGVLHPDLNGKNILVGPPQAPSGSGQGGGRLHLLDLDRVRWQEGPLSDGGRGMLRRLIRSLKKSGTLSTEGGGGEEALERGFRKGGETAGVRGGDRLATEGG